MKAKHVILAEVGALLVACIIGLAGDARADRVIPFEKRTIKTIGHWPCEAGEIIERVDGYPATDLKVWRCGDR